MSCRRRGVALIELIVAAFLFGVVMSIIVATWQGLNLARATQQTVIETRQLARTLFSDVTADLQGATYIFWGYNGPLGSDAAMDGHAQLEATAVPQPGQSGDALLYAVPDRSSGLPNTYTLVALWVESQTGALPEPSNPQPSQVRMVRMFGVTAPVGLASSINPASATPSSWTSRVFPLYLKEPGGALFTLSNPATSVTLNLEFSHQLQGGRLMDEVFSTEITCRLQ
jgi:type II secretory pathway pseudopilin PulG